MPRRVAYLTAWVGATTVATVVGLAAVGAVRGVVGGDQPVAAITQAEVRSQLETAAATPTVPTTSGARDGGSGVAQRPGETSTGSGSGGGGQASSGSSTRSVGSAGSPGGAGSRSSGTGSSGAATGRPAAPAQPPAHQSTPSSPPTTTAAPEPAASTGTWSTRTSDDSVLSVTATCTKRANGDWQVTGTASVTGSWRIAESELAPDSHIQVKFSGRGEIEVSASCSGGQPVFRRSGDD